MHHILKQSYIFVYGCNSYNVTFHCENGRLMLSFREQYGVFKVNLAGCLT